MSESERKHGKASAKVVLDALRAADATLAVAESCTGGLLGGALTTVPGSSAVFMGGVIAYDDAIKRDLLDVSPIVLAAHGAVSAEVAERMADAVADKACASFGRSVTGVAGPGGGSDDKPVGTVWIGVAGPAGTEAFVHRFSGNRASVRAQSVAAALGHLHDVLQAQARDLG